MAAVTGPGGTAYASHLEGIDFAGKTGTAQVVSHSAGMNKIASDVASRPNAWFVGIAPRRNPDIVVVVLWQHGGWGSGSARLAARVITSYVEKQRRQDHNLIEAKAPSTVDMGALWSAPAPSGRKKTEAKLEGAAQAGVSRGDPPPAMRGGHFLLKIPGRKRPGHSGKTPPAQLAKLTPIGFR
jgi:penicillin-binding protein 2